MQWMLSLFKMAASLTCHYLRNAHQIIAGFRCRAVTSSHWRHYATSCKGVQYYRKPRIAVAPDGNSIICWHPEPEFPYEYSQPMPREEGEAAQGETPLKVNFLVEEKLKMRPDGPTDNELSNMFFTTKHMWRPRPRATKLRPKKSPVDRDGL